MDSKIKMVEKALEAIVKWSVAYKETHAARWQDDKPKNWRESHAALKKISDLAQSTAEAAMREAVDLPLGDDHKSQYLSRFDDVQFDWVICGVTFRYSEKGGWRLANNSMIGQRYTETARRSRTVREMAEMIADFSDRL